MPCEYSSRTRFFARRTIETFALGLSALVPREEPQQDVPSLFQLRPGYGERDPLQYLLLVERGVVSYSISRAVLSTLQTNLTRTLLISFGAWILIPAQIAHELGYPRLVALAVMHAEGGSDRAFDGDRVRQGMRRFSRLTSGQTSRCSPPRTIFQSRQASSSCIVSLSRAISLNAGPSDADALPPRLLEARQE